MIDKQAFTKLMTHTALAYKEDLDKPRLSVYYDHLNRYDKETLVVALRKICETSRFFPRISDIIEVIEGSIEDKAIASWTLIEYAMEQGPCPKEPSVKNPLFAETIASVGGWDRLEDIYRDTTVLWEKKRQEFIRSYVSSTRRVKKLRILLEEDQPLLLEGGNTNEEDTDLGT